MRKKTNVVRPSSTKAIEAKCHDCMGNYADGRVDCCKKDCPLYYWMPYRELEPDLEWKKFSTRSKGVRLPRVSPRGKKSSE